MTKREKEAFKKKVAKLFAAKRNLEQEIASYNTLPHHLGKPVKDNI